MCLSSRPVVVLLLVAGFVRAHAPILPPIAGPLTVQGTRLLDRGTPITLRGMSVAADGLRQPR